MAAGASGFAGEEQLDLVMQAVYGVRQWSRGAEGRLQGVHSFAWADGENVARCDSRHRPPHSADHQELTTVTRRRDSLYAEMQRISASHPKGITDLSGRDRERYDRISGEYQRLHDDIQNGAYTDCGCGFWAYWALNPSEFRMGEKPIVGVIKGYGKVLLGTRGFRSEKAKIVGLHLAYEYVKPKAAPERPPASEGWSSMFASDYETNSPEALSKLASDEAELGGLYPGAVVYATLDAMLKAHPPTREYGALET